MSVNSPPQLLVYGVVSNEGGHAVLGGGVAEPGASV